MMSILLPNLWNNWMRGPRWRGWAPFNDSSSTIVNCCTNSASAHISLARNALSSPRSISWTWAKVPSWPPSTSATGGSEARGCSLWPPSSSSIVAGSVSSPPIADPRFCWRTVAMKRLAPMVLAAPRFARSTLYICWRCCEVSSELLQYPPSIIAPSESLKLVWEHFLVPLKFIQTSPEDVHQLSLFFMLFLQLFISILHDSAVDCRRCPKWHAGCRDVRSCRAHLWPFWECATRKPAMQAPWKTRNIAMPQFLLSQHCRCWHWALLGIGPRRPRPFLQHHLIWTKARKKHDLSHGFGQFCHLFPMAMLLALLFKLILPNQLRAISMGHVQLVHEKFHPLTRKWFCANVRKVPKRWHLHQHDLTFHHPLLDPENLARKVFDFASALPHWESSGTWGICEKKMIHYSSCEKTRHLLRKIPPHKVDTSACSSATHELKLMTLWVLLLPNKKHPFNMCMPLLVDLLWLWLDDKSESLKLSKIDRCFSNVFVQAGVSPTPSKCLMSSPNTPQAFWDVEVMPR